MPPLRRSPARGRTRQKRTGLFDPKAFLTRAGIGRTVLRFRQKQVVFSQGDPADTVYYIQEGRVRLSVVSKQGKEATLALLSPGDFLGEGRIADDQPVRMITATAITDCSVLRIDVLPS